MTDTTEGKGGDLERTENGGRKDQGRNGEAGEAAGSEGQGPGLGQRDPDRDSGPGEGQDGDHDLHFRLQILEALKAETDPQVRIHFLNLLESEGQRKAEIAQQELTNGLEEVRSDAKALGSRNKATLWAAIFDTLQKFGNWMAATAFAFILAWWWIQFMRNGKDIPANHIKDMLMVMLGGALGWIGKEATSRNTDNS